MPKLTLSNTADEAKSLQIQHWLKTCTVSHRRCSKEVHNNTSIQLSTRLVAIVGSPRSAKSA